jgi:hypothetical protein
MVLQGELVMAAADVDAFLSKLDEANRAELGRIRSLMLEIVPEATELTSYGIPFFLSTRASTLFDIAPLRRTWVCFRGARRLSY